MHFAGTTDQMLLTRPTHHFTLPFQSIAHVIEAQVYEGLASWERGWRYQGVPGLSSPDDNSAAPSLLHFKFLCKYTYHLYYVPLFIRPFPPTSLTRKIAPHLDFNTSSPILHDSDFPHPRRLPHLFLPTISPGVTGSGARAKLSTAPRTSHAAPPAISAGLGWAGRERTMRPYMHLLRLPAGRKRKKQRDRHR